MNPTFERQAYETRIQELEDQIFVLKDALGLTYRGNPEWGLGPTATQVLGAIAKTTLATNERIRTAVWGMKNDPPEDKVLHVHVCKINAKLKAYGVHIENKHGVGYYLPDASRAVVLAAQ